MGPPGTIQAARIFFQGVDLRRFRRRSEIAFAKELNAATNELEYSLPEGAQHWGSSRKFLNIFLRGCLYNQYICKAYSLDRLEPWLEVPLDSHIAKGLKRSAGRGQLPRWTTVIGLSQENSELFQAYASDFAARQKTFRVHLDLKFWRGGA